MFNSSANSVAKTYLRNRASGKTPLTAAYQKVETQDGPVMCYPVVGYKYSNGRIEMNDKAVASYGPATNA